MSRRNDLGKAIAAADRTLCREIQDRIRSTGKADSFGLLRRVLRIQSLISCAKTKPCTIEVDFLERAQLWRL